MNAPEPGNAKATKNAKRMNKDDKDVRLQTILSSKATSRGLTELSGQSLELVQWVQIQQHLLANELACGLVPPLGHVRVCRCHLALLKFIDSSDALVVVIPDAGGCTVALRGWIVRLVVVQELRN